MMTRWLAISLTLLCVACDESPNIHFPDRNSIGLSRPLIEIYEPLGDTPLPANKPFIIDFAVLRSEDGDYLKLRVDQGKAIKIYHRHGKHQVAGLPPGKHQIRLTEYTRDGRETGGDITLKLTMVAMPQD
jgi:hypothetical protein